MTWEERLCLYFASAFAAFSLPFMLARMFLLPQPGELEVRIQEQATQIARLDDRLDNLEPTRTPRPTVTP